MRGDACARPRERGAARLEPHSVWLHDSLRAAIGPATAVTSANVTSVQHSFRVLLGTFSVLRSNALNTGQNAVRAVLGTVTGSIIGAVLLQLIGHHGTVPWLLLPVAVLIAGIAPAVISFAAGQAAFTVTLVVLFNIGNLAAADLSQVTRAVKRKLKMLQYRPEVIDGCLAGPGLTFNK